MLLEVRGEVLLHADEVVATVRPLSAADARAWEECVSADDAYSFDSFTFSLFQSAMTTKEDGVKYE